MSAYATIAITLALSSPTKDLLVTSEMHRIKGVSLAERRIAANVILEHSEKLGLDPLLVLAIIRVESAFDPQAVSIVGAQGLMQLMPPTAQWISARHDLIYRGHSFMVLDNILQGMYYYAFLLERYNGNHAYALTAYNRGPRATDYILTHYGELPVHVREFYSDKVQLRWWTLLAKWDTLRETGG